MPCATPGEEHLIRLFDAARYAGPGTLCSPLCRQALEWSDWETAVAKVMYELLRNLENVLRMSISTRRVAHQDRIGGRDLAADRRSVLTAIRYVSEAAARRVDAADIALPALLESGPGVCSQRGKGRS